VRKKQILKNAMSYDVVQGFPLANRFDVFITVKYLCTDSIAGNLGREDK
jgi:hypothetical protein